MAATTTYKSVEISITATEINNANGASKDQGVTTLPTWDRVVLSGVIQDKTNAVMPNAGIEIYKLATAATPITSDDLIGTIFADNNGKYGVSLPLITGEEVYKLIAYTKL